MIHETDPCATMTRSCGWTATVPKKDDGAELRYLIAIGGAFLIFLHIIIIIRSQVCTVNHVLARYVKLLKSMCKSDFKPRLTAYVDNQLLGTGKVSEAAILALDNTGVWAISKGYSAKVRALSYNPPSYNSILICYCV